MSIKETSFMWRPLEDGTVIIDRWCHCGHKQSEHNDARYGKLKGRGNCTKCPCERFLTKSLIQIPNPEIKYG